MTPPPPPCGWVVLWGSGGKIRNLHKIHVVETKKGHSIMVGHDGVTAELAECRKRLEAIAQWRDDLASVPVPPDTESDVWLWTTQEMAEELTHLLEGEL